jgi:hypothetical protein
MNLQIYFYSNSLPSRQKNHYRMFKTATYQQIWICIMSNEPDTNKNIL